ncbi:thiamine pyrophosphate-binding protein [Luteolibacter sp. SL250]|uniref:thiamine pyrophosphate-binding protein n=1 Tax=Luteolibacter sp. SL250 TaxID=2995170 RepID=UPI00226DA41A|nr:thiamine pyrophosphate-binding protein [Luteolibacter sp. SL250]WAC20871.1 thiamine pyrophosphate-binding protein [Luteolibacter sp. SL250]
MSSWTKAVEVVETCIRTGISEFVVCAGARNAALIEALARAEKAGHVRLWRHFEERSAGFFALGRMMETGLPCAVVTTSGTAVAELLPAVVEASYQARPLVALTADRPAAFRGTGAPQSIDQTGIFGGHAFAGSPEGWDGKGPLHWNVEFEEEFVPGDEDFTGGASGNFEPAKDRLDVAALARWLREGLYRGLVVMIGGLEPEEREEVFHFCRTLEVPVMAEATSGLREALQMLSLPDGDRQLRANPPGKILRLGEVPSGRFWRDLENLPDVSVWSVCRNGLPGLARESGVVRGAVDRVLRALGEMEPAEDAMDYFQGASRSAAVIDELLEAYPDSEPGLLRTLSHYVSTGSSLFLGNSMPIREWNLFSQRDRPIRSVRANRGVNGIDGQVSTWLGWTAELGDAWAVVGDLTALYDLAGPFVLDQIVGEGRVLVVINNGGGKIFERLPRLASMSPRAADCMTNPQTADLAGWAQLWGMDHLRITTVDDFDRFEPRDKMLLLEIIPDAGQTKAFWGKWDQHPPQ